MTIEVYCSAVGDLDVSEKDARKINNLQLQMNNRPIWMAASVHKGEEEGDVPFPHLRKIL